MQRFIITAKFLRDYLQDRFSTEAQEGLKVKAGTKAKIEDDESWKKLLYSDKKGCYIPSLQILQSLIGAGKGIKKKPYGSFKEIVQSYFIVGPENIYFGKTNPDYIKESFPARADGLRVRKGHPAFNAGTQFIFEVMISSDEIDDKTIKMIVQKAGLEKGIGAWRAGGHGRFEVVKFEKK